VLQEEHMRLQSFLVRHENKIPRIILQRIRRVAQFVRGLGTYELANQFYVAMDNKDYLTAEAILNEVEDLVGMNDHQWLSMAVYFGHKKPVHEQIIFETVELNDEHWHPEVE
jgi:hypothetical protein